MIVRFTYMRRLFCSACIAVIFLIVHLCRDDVKDILDRRSTLLKIDENIRKYANIEACKQPDLPVNSSEMMTFLKYVPPIDCSSAGIDWVICENSECRIREEIKIQKGPIKCSFTDIIRTDDFINTDGETTSSDSYYKLEKSDVVRVYCVSSEEKWSSVLTGIRFDKNIWDRSGWEYVPDDGLKLDVLMFGFDSLSRNTFMRKLPLSYKYLTENLGTLVLKGYNIVGDGTPQALTPILTGKSELELPDARKRVPNADFVDVYPFIWKDFQDNGYVTGYFEDCPAYGIYTYRLKGFQKPPVDHYMRPYYLSSSKYLNKWPKWCAGSVPRHKVMMNQIKYFFSAYKTKPKFLFGFHGELSHDDYNLIGGADLDVLHFLKDLHNSGVLNNTLFIFMADHGHRFAAIRNTVQGKLEERLPFFSFTFPTWFKTKHKTVYENFQNNLNTLTTPFDIYSTLKNVLHLENIGEADTLSRSLSLFSKISKERSCAQAYIEPHWCACLEWFAIKLSSPIVQQLSDSLVKTLNDITELNRDKCATLKVSAVYWVSKLSPNENLIKYKKNSDLDGFEADLSAKMDITTDIYQLKVMLSPGDSLFEASITHHVKEDRMELKTRDISRINMYGNQARCIYDTYPHLRKYCYCTSD